MLAKPAPNGKTYLNVGCGCHFSSDWNNLDLHGPPGVVDHDVREALPFAAASFDAVYSSHVIEHLEPEEGEYFLREQFRVLKPGGTCRVVVPDLERLCRDYLNHLEKAEADPREILSYRWTVLFLVDQLVREDCGGEMLKAFGREDFDPEFIRSRIGEEAMPFLEKAAPARKSRLSRLFGPSLAKRLKRILGRDARGRGEAHRWMYDRLSLRLLLDKVGFADFRIVSHLESSIPGWAGYRLDTAKDGQAPRKPDSLFVEASKPQNKVP
jgi:predicted SAM-dependent methyltransferase